MSRFRLANLFPHLSFSFTTQNVENNTVIGGTGPSGSSIVINFFLTLHMHKQYGLRPNLSVNKTYCFWWLIRSYFWV